MPEEVRDPLRAHLTARRIGSEIYYPIPLHLQTCFASLGHQPGDFPQAEAAARQTIALPMYPEVSEAARRHVVGAIAEYFRDRGRLRFETGSATLKGPHDPSSAPTRAVGGLSIRRDA